MTHSCLTVSLTTFTLFSFDNSLQNPYHELVIQESYYQSQTQISVIVNKTNEIHVYLPLALLLVLIKSCLSYSTFSNFLHVCYRQRIILKFPVPHVTGIKRIM